MSGISLEGLSPRYQYLNLFNANGDKVLDESDHLLFRGVESPQAAEKAVTENLEALSALPTLPQMCLTRPSLDVSFSKAHIPKIRDKKTGQERPAITDGDTVKIDQDLNHDGQPDVIRLKGANTTEFGKGPTLASRLKGAEPGAITAWNALTRLFEQVDYRVFVRPERSDRYGRFVSPLFVETSEGYLDIEAYLVHQGLGMVYFVQVEDYQNYFCYLLLQAQAQKSRKGLWSLAEFKDRNDPAGNKLKPLHITSFHPDAAREKGNAEPLHGEYFRIVALSSQPINLADFEVVQRSRGWFSPNEEVLSLPSFVVPPGRTVKVATGGIQTNANPEAELVLSLGMTREFWKNKKDGGACLVIRTKKGKHVIDSSAKYGFDSCP